VLEHVLPVFLEGAEIRLDVRQDRFFVEVVTDDFRHQRVHGFVIRHAVAQRIGDPNVAGAVSIDEPRDPDQ